MLQKIPPREAQVNLKTHPHFIKKKLPKTILRKYGIEMTERYIENCMSCILSPELYTTQQHLAFTLYNGMGFHVCSWCKEVFV